jgi:hypothetical protein
MALISQRKKETIIVYLFLCISFVAPVASLQPVTFQMTYVTSFQSPVRQLYNHAFNWDKTISGVRTAHEVCIRWASLHFIGIRMRTRHLQAVT